jgi:flagellar M-ring protein FliF
MDFLNKAYAQISDLFRSLTPGTQLVAVLLAGAIVVGLVYVVQYQGSSGDEFLLGGRPFSDAELTAIEAAFAKARLGGSKLEGNRIRIPRGNKAEYLAALADNNALPADFYKHLNEATDSDSPFSSTKALEMRRWNAKQKELALIISRMRGISAATVQFDEIEKDGFRRLKEKRAVVAVQTSQGALEETQVKAIRNLIAGAYAGLDKRNVTITDMTSGLSFAAIGEDGTGAEESIYAATKEKFERDWRKKIVEQLAMIPNVVVGVNVELTPEIKHTTQSVKLDPKPVAVQSSEFSKESSVTTPNNAGRPGAVPNGVGNQPVALAAAPTPTLNSQNTESRSETRNLPGQERSTVERAGLVPTMVTASIDVPRSYLGKIWKERNALLPDQAGKQPDAAEIAKIETETVKKIQEIVRNLLPPVEKGTNPWPHITVTTYTDIPSPAPAPPTFADTASTWLASNWQSVALVVVALASLLMLRGMLRHTPSPAAAAAAASAAAHYDEPAAEEAEEEPQTVKMLSRAFSGGGPNLKEELQSLVKENPDVAASVLRAWIGDAA